MLLIKTEFSESKLLPLMVVVITLLYTGVALRFYFEEV